MSLPYVPAPYPDEWLGFWLHRIAAAYGLNVARLLGELDCPGPTRLRPTWGQIHTLNSVEIDQLSKMLRENRSALKAMQHLVSPRAPAAQVGCCPECLRQDTESGRQMYWRQNWMDPYLGWCDQHQCPLMPVDISEIRSLKTATSTIAVLKSFVKGAMCHVSSKGSSPSDDEIRSIASLHASLIRESHSLQPDRPKPLRKLVDVIAIRRMRFARQFALKKNQRSGFQSARPDLCRQKRTDGYLANMKSLSQRTEAKRLVATILWPVSSADLVRRTFWQSLTSDDHHWIALWLTAANAKHMYVDWPEAQNYASEFVQRDNESELGFSWRP